MSPKWAEQFVNQQIRIEYVNVFDNWKVSEDPLAPDQQVQYYREVKFYIQNIPSNLC